MEHHTHCTPLRYGMVWTHLFFWWSESILQQLQWSKSKHWRVMDCHWGTYNIDVLSIECRSENVIFLSCSLSWLDKTIFHMKLLSLRFGMPCNKRRVYLGSGPNSFRLLDPASMRVFQDWLDESLLLDSFLYFLVVRGSCFSSTLCAS